MSQILQSLLGPNNLKEPLDKTPTTTDMVIKTTIHLIFEYALYKGYPLGELCKDF